MKEPAGYILDAISAQVFARLEQAAHEAATSPWNKLKAPTRAQMLAVNWKHGHIELRPGLRVKIENPRGTFRSGKTPGGIQWENRMGAHYGDIVGTKGADGDPVDIFVGPFPESDKVWVINQRQNWPGATGFDEHKVMTGFMTEEQARAAYLGSYQRGWDGLESIVPCTYAQLKWWLRYGDCTARFTTENLPNEGTSIMDQAVRWDADANPVGQPLHQLVYVLRRDDAGQNLLLDTCTMEDLMSDPDIEATVTLDAMVAEVSKMSLKMEALRKVMDAAGDKVKAPSFDISDPVRARGVLQVMVLFQMNDGQTVSIWFHNPDTTPAKLTPLDELVSWKWMLNKKDVTIVVAPERGQELNIREVARRIMRLVEKNSTAFKKANEKAAARVKEVADLKAEISVLEVELADWQRKIAVEQMQQAEAPTPKERWDSARGHASAVNKAVRAEIIDGLIIQDPAVLAEVTRMLGELRALATGAAEAETPEALRTQVDSLAVAVRAKAAEGAKAQTPAAVEAAAAAPEPAGTADRVLSGLGVSPEDIAAMADDGGYAAIVADEKLSLKWQDVLDSALQQRLVDVRNALRESGWKGSGTSLSKDIGGSVYGISHDVRAVGAGKNVVQIIWIANGERVVDDLLVKAAEMATRLDAAVSTGIAAAQAAAGAPAAEPVAAVDSMEVKIAKAAELGAAEFAAGAKGVPALSTALAELLKDTGNHAGEVISAWVKAWHRANILAPVPETPAGPSLVVVQTDGRWRVASASNMNPISPSYPTEIEAQAAADAALAAGNLEFPDASDAAELAAAKEAQRSPTDAELEAAAKAGAEVRKVTRNRGEKGAVPRAALATEDHSVMVLLWTESDVTRAVRAVHDEEDMANYRPFDPSALKMPTAVQLGINQRNTLVLPTSDADEKMTLDGWSNGHLMDFTQRPGFIDKAITKYYGEPTSPFIRRYAISKIERIEVAAKSRSTKVEPMAHHDFERLVNTTKKQGKVPVNSVVLANEGGTVWVTVDAKYLAYFWKTYKGCEFFADGPDVSVGVRHHGKLVGVIMPMRSDNETLARAQRVTAKAKVEENPGELSPAVVDAAYKFDDATDTFKIAVAHSVAETSYSPFLSARTMDERAKALGLAISWDIQSVVLDSLPVGFDVGAAIALIEEPSERALDAIADAARRYVPVLDFTGDVSAAIAQLEIALDVVVTNEPINRKRGNIEQADLEASNAAQFRSAIHFLKAGATLDDASGDAGGEEWETVVGTIKRGGEVIGRAVVADGDGKAMVYLGATGKQRVTYVSSMDGVRRNAMWSDDDAGDMIDWLVENIAAAEQQAQAAIAAAAAPAPEAVAQVEEPAATGGGEPPADPPATPPVDTQPEPERGATSEKMGRAFLAEIANFMPKAERKGIEAGMSGEEKQYFFDLIADLRERIWKMPKVYEQDGKGGQAVVYLHYFNGGSDWYITERDYEMDDQQQAFGLADLGHGGDLGYISIDELVSNGVELDLHWTPKTLDEVRGTTPESVEMLSENEEDPNIGRTWRSPQGVKQVIDFKAGRYTVTIDDEDGEREGLPVDADDLEQEIRDDERAVSEAEAEARAKSDAEAEAGGAELEAAGFKRIGTKGNEYGKSVQVSETGTARFNVRHVGGNGYPEGWKVMKSVVFNNGVTGAPSQDLGRFDTPAQAIAAVNAELAARGVAAPATIEPVSQLRPITPQSPERIEWENAVTEAVIRLADVSRGDAQAMLEADPDRLDKFWEGKSDPDWTAEQITGVDAQPASPALNKGELMKRYADAKLASYRITQGGEHEAQIATKYALEDEETQFKRRMEHEGEQGALYVLAQDVEDAEKAARERAVAAAPAADPAKEADRAYLQTLIDGTADMLDAGILERIEPMFAKYEADAEMTDILAKAANAYGDAATAAAKLALG